MKSITKIMAVILVCSSGLAFTKTNQLISNPNNDTGSPGMESGYYVVIGAYAASKEHYAKLYSSKVNSMGYESTYGFSERRKLYFVYLRYSQNYRESIAKMREARKVDEFKEAWVFVSFDEELIADNISEGQEAEVEKNEVVESLNEMYAAKFDEKEDNEATEESSSQLSKQEQTSTEAVADNTETQVADNEVPAEMAKSNEVALNDITLENKEVKKIETLGDMSLYCSLVNARNNKSVDGEIQIIDAERAKLLKVVQAGDYVQLGDPKNGTGKLLLICDVFGYKKTQRMINYYHPFPDTVEQHINMITDVYAINFGLQRYRKGDIATMYNVYFYKDASLMRPESKFELNNLVNMMNENPDYKIKIHGHVNGKHAGKIISQGESGDYFSLDDGNKVGFGSAVELSKQRAEIIRQYLIENGIDESRMEVKAWGGKRMLHDKHSSMAKHNVRVEVEILDE